MVSNMKVEDIYHYNVGREDSAKEEREQFLKINYINNNNESSTNNNND